MDALQEYNIPFTGLKLGKHNFNYHIDNTFFTAFDYHDFNSIDCRVAVAFTKKTTLLELLFTIKGMASVNCDTTNEPYNQPIESSFNLLVKFGDFFNDDNDEVLILPHTAYQVNVSQYIYETIVLSLPVKREHPGLKDGTLKSEVLDKLRELEANKTKETDPRWDKLNELLTSKKE